jgi:alkylation response protein AidB-like acyl-CoA dehydrogenase
LEGKKPWCSGADVVDAALVSCIDECGNRRLAEVSFHQPSVVLSPSTWAAEGMRGARTVEATFTDAPARLIGGPSAYLDRPGFWQGAVGIAACWYGGARGVARHLRRACARRADSHALAHLGVVDRSLQAAAAALREAARYVDAHPTANVQRLALAVRDLIEDVVHEVVARTDRALGPGPRATDVEYATRVEDLTVFVRQNHAERDRETLGRLCLDSLDDRWNLDAHDL